MFMILDDGTEKIVKTDKKADTGEQHNILIAASLHIYLSIATNYILFYRRYL